MAGSKRTKPNQEAVQERGSTEKVAELVREEIEERRRKNRGKLMPDFSRVTISCYSSIER